MFKITNISSIYFDSNNLIHTLQHSGYMNKLDISTPVNIINQDIYIYLEREREGDGKGERERERHTSHPRLHQNQWPFAITEILFGHCINHEASKQRNQLIMSANLEQTTDDEGFWFLKKLEKRLEMSSSSYVGKEIGFWILICNE